MGGDLPLGGIAGMTAAAHRRVSAIPPFLYFAVTARQDTIAAGIVTLEPMKRDLHQVIAKHAMTVLGIVFAMFQLVCGA